MPAKDAPAPRGAVALRGTEGRCLLQQHETRPERVHPLLPSPPSLPSLTPLPHSPPLPPSLVPLLAGGYSQGTLVGRGTNSAPSEPAYDAVTAANDPSNQAAASVAVHGSHVRRMGLAELATATDHFCAGELIGAGGFGSVFKGRLADGRQVAVKRRARNSLQGDAEFFNEVRRGSWRRCG